MEYEWITPGIPDSEFIRDKVPMTKEEVRTTVLSKLRLNSDSNFLDIGGGTGSVTVEAARLIPEGTVVTIEEKDEACSIIQKNLDHFDIKNVTLYNDPAPSSKIDERFDRIFIGGSGKSTDEILAWASSLLCTNGRMVATAITLESFQKLLTFFTSNNYTEIDTIQLQLTRIEKKGSKHMFLAENPIFIIAGEKND